MTNFIILSLATWRLSSLTANELGPIDILEKIRYTVGVRYNDGTRYATNGFAAMLICVWCNSVWAGSLVALFYYLIGEPLVYLCLPFALSAIAVIIHELGISYE